MANLESVNGNEQGGIRPVLILQNNIHNKHSPLTIIAPVTSKIYEKEYPTNVFLDKKDSGLNKDSTILLNQIRAIDKRRIIKKLSSINKYLLKKVELAIKVSLSLE